MGETDHTADISSTVPASEVSGTSPEPVAIAQIKTADRPHPITIVLGIFSPLLALISLGVSFYVFRDSQRSMRVAQRAYLGFHFESAQVAPESDDKANGPKKFRVGVNLSVKDIGNTPAYIEMVKKELYAIEADDMWHHIGGSKEVSPNFDALGPKDEPLILKYNSVFTDQDFKGDRSVVYRVEVRWHDAFGEIQPPTIFCAILTDVSLPMGEKRPLSPEPCIKGMTLSVGSSR